MFDVIYDWALIEAKAIYRVLFKHSGYFDVYWEVYYD